MLTIADLKKGESFIVTRIRLDREVGQRLGDMGFVEGAEGQVVRLAPGGGPVQVKICHYHLSLRLSESQGVEVSRKEP